MSIDSRRRGLRFAAIHGASVALMFYAAGFPAAAFSAASGDQSLPAGTGAGANRDKPLWEAGFGAGLGLFADYPASDHYQVKGLPFPYIIYRGKILRSDNQGVRTRAFIRRNVQFELSATGSFPADSDNDDARSGMPDLDYLGEIGPKLRITAARPSADSRVYVDLPLRVVLSTDLSHFDYRGFVFAPAVGYQNDYVFGPHWGFRASFASRVASAALQDYFYQVDPKYARPGRPSYDAHAGYLGSSLDLSLAYRATPHVSVLLFTQLNYQGAENRHSPLFNSNTGYAAGLGFVWSIFQSERTVPAGR